jgi:hypothetical protein
LPDVAVGYEDGLCSYESYKSRPLKVRDPHGLSGSCDEDCIRDSHLEYAECLTQLGDEIACKAFADAALLECARANAGDSSTPPGCTHAPPAPPGPICDVYPPCKEYTGASLKCFCNCASSSPWNDAVRGCLACYEGRGCGNTSAAREICYAAAHKHSGGVWDPFELLGCLIKCQ